MTKSSQPFLQYRFWTIDPLVKRWKVFADPAWPRPFFQYPSMDDRQHNVIGIYWTIIYYYTILYDIIQIYTDIYRLLCFFCRINMKKISHDFCIRVGKLPTWFCASSAKERVPPSLMKWLPVLWRWAHGRASSNLDTQNLWQPCSFYKMDGLLQALQNGKYWRIRMNEREHEKHNQI